MSCVYAYMCVCVCVFLLLLLPEALLQFTAMRSTRTASRVHFLAQHKSMLPIYVCLCKGSTYATWQTIGLLFQPRRAQAQWFCVCVARGLNKA